MLKINDIKDGFIEESIEIDEHVPFNINWNHTNSSYSNYYWRTGNFKNSLFEIGLDSLSGVIKNMGLPLSNKVSMSEKILETNYSVQGFPKFELSHWTSEYYYDFFQEFSIELFENGLSICFYQDNVEEIVKTNRVLFHISKERILSRIDLIDLSSDEIFRITKSVSYPSR
ncbi:hypothetical protein BK133_23220 [Paenibacillus sp. FSL H8-0548]|uniref:hypothetical protein n=1 Tax=Paenibacillus sp. FSL H8-0548 TaxID=1920422 RepID=UPI00096C94C2|nr:hypothetical protein [Paenibacillus sp. FSL H8-0548]OMF24131.1 hypothetical protein BK133_23220 [Paenibacillus sp. FSL H8-0548]